MKKLKFENLEWEETITYYYAHNNIELTDFLNDVNILEKLNINKNTEYESIEYVDLRDLMSNSNLKNQKILDIKIFIDDWDYKVLLIILADYFVIRIQEVYA